MPETHSSVKIYNFSRPSGKSVAARHVCTLEVPPAPPGERMTWCGARSGDRGEETTGHFRADPSRSIVVLYLRLGGPTHEDAAEDDDEEEEKTPNSNTNTTRTSSSPGRLSLPRSVLSNPFALAARETGRTCLRRCHQPYHGRNGAFVSASAFTCGVLTSTSSLPRYRSAPGCPGWCPTARGRRTRARPDPCTSSTTLTPLLRAALSSDSMRLGDSGLMILTRRGRPSPIIMPSGRCLSQPWMA